MTDPLVQDATIYAEDQGITLAEAVRRLRLNDHAGDLSAGLEAEESDTFAGLWIQHAPTYAIVVSFTFDGEDTVQRHVDEQSPLQGFLEVRKGTRSLEELRALQQESMDLMTRLGITAEHGLVVQESRVETYVTSKDDARFRLRAADEELPQDVTLVEVEHLGGQELRIYAGLRIHCTAGYTVEHTSSQKTGVTTAGHCPNDQEYGGYPLPYFAGADQGSYDVQWNTTPEIDDKPWAKDSHFDSATPYYRHVTGTRSRYHQALNDFVCKYGQETGFTCGYIIDREFAHQGTATWIRVHRSGYDLSSPGDSGGPWYKGGTAFGIHTGHPGQDEDAFYMAINYIAILGITVLTT